MVTITSGDNQREPKYIAFFDLDFTLINVNSGKVLIRSAYDRGHMTRMDLLRGIFLSLTYKLDLTDTTRIIDAMVGWLRGVPVDELDKLTSEIFNNQIIHAIRQEVKAEISFHSRESARIVMLSSSIMPLCRNVAEYLGIEDILCSNLQVKNGIYTGYTEGPLCFGKEKVTRLSEFCIGNNIDPSICWYYGDSISDLQALSIVGHPVCINPDKKLRRAAARRAWKIYEWH